MMLGHILGERSHATALKSLIRHTSDLACQEGNTVIITKPSVL